MSDNDDGSWRGLYADIVAEVEGNDMTVMMTHGIRIVSYIDADGEDGLAWVVDGQPRTMHLIGSLEVLKTLLMAEKLQEGSDEEDDGEAA